MHIKALELVPRCTNCYGDSPKAYKREQTQPMSNITSEYQAAFKDWPWHPRPQSMKPDQKKVSAGKSKSHMERKSTYGIDFVYHPLPKKKTLKKHRLGDKVTTGDEADDQDYTLYFPKTSVVSRMKSPNVENAKVIHPSNSQPFQGDTIYSAAYTLYDAVTMAASKPPPVKIKDSIEKPTVSEKAVQKSTAQDDYIHHEKTEKLAADISKLNTERPSEPKDKHAGSKGFSTTKQSICKVKPEPKFEAISTAMADFTKPEGFEKPVPCPPPVSNHYVPCKFDGTTTSSEAYKPFPVKRYELPIWAKKPIYKRPKGGMVLNSLYMHDFKDPEMIQRPSPIRPQIRKKNMLTNNDKGDHKFDGTSTYKHDFLLWENVHPRESYRMIEVYQPPKEKMICKTNYRSDFTGVKADKMKPCRHSSEHRKLNTDTGMTFVTTYNETFRNLRPRPKSTPSTGSEPLASSQQRASSARQSTTSDVQSTPKSTSINKIPTPDLRITPSNLLTEHGSVTPKWAENNSATKSGPGHVDILKIVHTCEKCRKDVTECKCGEE